MGDMKRYKSYPTEHDHEFLPDDSYDRLTAVLRELPKGHVVRWTDMTYIEGVYVGSVDVWADEVCDRARLSWAWTIEDPDREKPEWEEDEEFAEIAGDDWFTIAVPPDTTYTHDDPYLRKPQPAWYPETIDRVLEGWVAEHTGRTALRFRSDPDLVTPLELRLREQQRESEAFPKWYKVEELDINDGQDQRVLEAVQGLPRDFVIRWHDDIVYQDGMYHLRVDVWAPAICEPVGLLNAWDIRDEPRDCDCPEGMGMDLQVPRDATVDDWPTWKPETINQVLEAWVADYARRPDLRFEVDTSLVSPMGARRDDRPTSSG